ncbi:MAG: sn-glycerol-1-phosphate dehydrogenase [Planctomycetota bacterium]|nr:sn-glycerol-1-phosphate dehydrogenase [Planctomycetota bacterium]
MTGSSNGSDFIRRALEQASDTRYLLIGSGTIESAASVFRDAFGEASATVVADPSTMQAAGNRVQETLRNAGVETLEPVVLDCRDLHATSEHVDHLAGALAPHGAIPLAVGSGTINDLTKLAAHRSKRPYMAVATAASMDGYTAYGASITHEGLKQTFYCPAPRAVIADVNVLADAPSEMNAAGYADLLAKIPAGADWILADALGVEPMHGQAWSLVQDRLRDWVADPEAIRRGDKQAVSRLANGLLMTGFAMQAAKSSRPASGADHQFSHLWDMQHHEHLGQTPLHGCKVAIGTLASTLLYERLFEAPIENLDTARICRNWHTLEDIKVLVEKTHALPDLRRAALDEWRAKYIGWKELSDRLGFLKATWPKLRDRLREQLLPFEMIRNMFHRAGAPSHPSEIGMELPRLRRGYDEARQIRRRYTVLDLATETGLMGPSLEQIFSADGPWGTASSEVSQSIPIN